MKNLVLLSSLVLFVGLNANAKQLECSSGAFLGRTLGVTATVTASDKLTNFKIGALAGRTFKFKEVFSSGAEAKKLKNGVPGFEGPTYQYNLGRSEGWTYILILSPKFLEQSDFSASVVESERSNGDGGILNSLDCTLR